MLKLRPAALALSAVVLLAGCSGSDEEPEATDASGSPTASESGDADTADTSEYGEPMTISAGESMTKRETHYKAVCLQWDGYQDGVAWHPSMLDNARASKNDLAKEAVNRIAEDIAADGEPSEETIAMMEQVCADVDR